MSQLVCLLKTCKRIFVIIDAIHIQQWNVLEGKLSAYSAAAAFNYAQIASEKLLMNS